MIGSSAPTNPLDAFLADLAAMRGRIADLERAAQRSTPRGVLGVHSLTTNYPTTGTHTTYQDDGLTKTVDETAGRRLRFTIAAHFYAPGGANAISYRLLRDGVQIAKWLLPSEAINAVNVLHSATFTYSEVVAVTHVASVFKTQVAAGINNTSVSSYGDASFIRQLIIEDIGVL